jgi:hypothetical protein
MKKVALQIDPVAKPIDDWQQKISQWLQKRPVLGLVLEELSPVASPIRHVGIVSSPNSSPLHSFGYELGRVIGEGSFSKVKVSTHILTGKSVF